tara:strand:+ start:565 stop:693 length:129 start_codon:yes stop_codon:yes gene_type:complete
MKSYYEKKHEILIFLAESAIGRKETLGLLNEVAKLNSKINNL